MERYRLQILCLVLCWCCFTNGICLAQRQCLVETAESFIGVREATGNNDGPEVEAFLRSTGLGKGYAWCVAFLTFIYEDCGVPNPKSAWSPDWGKEKDMIWQQGMSPRYAMVTALPGDITTFWYTSKGRIAHGEMLYYMTPAKVITIGGNTNVAGSREGDGVYVKERRWRSIYRITSYL